MSRSYCWRVGGPVEFYIGERCPECSAHQHEALRDDQCGHWTKCDQLGADGMRHGHLCELLPEHEGSHEAKATCDGLRDAGADGETGGGK